MDAAQLTGWVKPGEIWQLNFWIWILQAKENYFRIQYSMKIWTLLSSFYPERFLFSRIFAHSHFASTYHFLAFLILIFYGIAFWIKKIYTRSVTADTFNWLRRNFFGQNKKVEVWQLVDLSPSLILLHTFLGENSCGKRVDGKFSDAEMCVDATC